MLLIWLFQTIGLQSLVCYKSALSKFWHHTCHSLYPWFHGRFTLDFTYHYQQFSYFIFLELEWISPGPGTLLLTMLSATSTNFSVSTVSDPPVEKSLANKCSEYGIPPVSSPLNKDANSLISLQRLYLLHALHLHPDYQQFLQAVWRPDLWEGSSIGFDAFC